MRLLHKKTNQNDRERQFIFLRILGTAALLLFIAVFLVNGWFLYKGVYARAADVERLIHMQSEGLPRAIHFDRLEKTEAAWKEKQEVTLPAGTRNPFEPAVL